MLDEKMIIKSMVLSDVDRVKSVVSLKIDELYQKHDVTVSIQKTDVLDLITSVHTDIEDLISYIGSFFK